MKSSLAYTVPAVVSRLRLVSVAPIRDHHGTVHSGEAEFLVEPLKTTVSVFFPVGEHAEKLGEMVGSTVEVEVLPPSLRVSALGSAKRFQIVREEAPDVPAPFYRLTGIFRVYTPMWGVFECGNLRFEACFEREGWLEIRGVRFYASLPQ
ncbi:hypothetical protein [Thermococcus sp. 21S7]|uniref:hypothetical protein n=1 Tax=Thermococcus sp. 21S7 TaxID=1638221 RepID=UPI00143AEF51|nr:hypothetical protein [Thermococcus sp. 21S7]NJE60288.1 hypothetical protein [Thermococcus sp. 21S7]